MRRIGGVGSYAEASVCIDPFQHHPPWPSSTWPTIFASIEDHRRDQGKLHRLSDILTIALCAVVGGAEGWDDIAAFAQAKQAWFEERLKRKHGTPSSDTIRRVIARIDPTEFERCFLSWVRSVTEKIDGEVIRWQDFSRLLRQRRAEKLLLRVPVFARFQQGALHAPCVVALRQRAGSEGENAPRSPLPG